MKSELEASKKVQNELMRKSQRSRLGAQDPQLTSHLDTIQELEKLIDQICNTDPSAPLTPTLVNSSKSLIDKLRAMKSAQEKTDTSTVMPKFKPISNVPSDLQQAMSLENNIEVPPTHAKFMSKPPGADIKKSESAVTTSATVKVTDTSAKTTTSTTKGSSKTSVSSTKATSSSAKSTSSSTKTISTSSKSDVKSSSASEKPKVTSTKSTAADSLKKSVKKDSVKSTPSSKADDKSVKEILHSRDREYKEKRHSDRDQKHTSDKDRRPSSDRRKADDRSKRPTDDKERRQREKDHGFTFSQKKTPDDLRNKLDKVNN